MAKTHSMSLADLESLVQDRKKRLGNLKKKHQSLQKELDNISNEIASLEGKGGRRPGKSSGKKKKVRRRRAKNAKPLKEHVTEVLKRRKKGITLDDLQDKVVQSGYTSRSKNFKNVLYQCLYKNDEFVLDAEKGTYKLK